jgi:hypothetical protein
LQYAAQLNIGPVWIIRLIFAAPWCKRYRLLSVMCSRSRAKDLPYLPLECRCRSPAAEPSVTLGIEDCSQHLRTRFDVSRHRELGGDSELDQGCREEQILEGVSNMSIETEERVRQKRPRF